MVSALPWDKVESLLQELVRFQQVELLKTGKRIIPHVIPDDLRQPNDFPELEQNPHFRYDEGVLAGIQTVHMALQALYARLEHVVN